ncbi:hypothetical protein KC19_VG305100 [Ceratodon purpureus]|uniref:Uncharacterized protein n=1 Tax=Ceratodon purpureus TaxID=3225 RepID=A0A8T0HV77_CERPU|nr:hypothetical protein KC19_VG305100 [Ceratodon purpureus]
MSHLDCGAGVLPNVRPSLHHCQIDCSGQLSAYSGGCPVFCSSRLGFAPSPITCWRNFSLNPSRYFEICFFNIRLKTTVKMIEHPGTAFSLYCMKQTFLV